MGHSGGGTETRPPDIGQSSGMKRYGLADSMPGGGPGFTGGARSLNSEEQMEHEGAKR